APPGQPAIAPGHRPPGAAPAALLSARAPPPDDGAAHGPGAAPDAAAPRALAEQACHPCRASRCVPAASESGLAKTLHLRALSRPP
ncbi:MAG: hypothetical protein MI924_36130, partial [Chloroflexales bacterium]|nr:hypothetical protein [Chloroflexales bacterium]